MPDTPAVDGQDTLPASAESSTEVQTLPESTPSQEEAVQVEKPKLLFGKYKSEEEAEKAFKEAERKFLEKAEKASQLEKELSQVRERNQLTEVLSKLAETVQKKEPELDFDKFAEEMAAGMAEDPKETTKKLLRVVGSWGQQDKNTLLKEVRALRDEMTRIRDDVHTRMETSDPFYEAHKVVIDELVQGGMKIEAAKTFLRKMSVDTPTEGKAKPPVAVNGTSVAAVGKSSKSYLTAEEKERFRMEGMTDDDLAAMEATQRRNEELRRKEEESNR